jgi:hypothetical protein
MGSPSQLAFDEAVLVAQCEPHLAGGVGDELAFGGKSAGGVLVRRAGPSLHREREGARAALRAARVGDGARDRLGQRDRGERRRPDRAQERAERPRAQRAPHRAPASAVRPA